MSGPDLAGYVDVATRLKLALEQFPELRVQCSPPDVVGVEDRRFIAVTVRVWRSPDDPLPAIATAWEPFPGRTPFTRDSEMMNAETSALGRALGLLGVGISRSIATADEVNNRKADEAYAPARPAEKADKADRPARNGSATPGQIELIRKMAAERGLAAGSPDELSFEEASNRITELKRIPKP